LREYRGFGQLPDTGLDISTLLGCGCYDTHEIEVHPMRNHKLRVAGLVAAFLFAVGLAAIPQTKQTAHVSVQTIPPRTEDVSSIDNIVQASYETISGGVGVPRQWGRDRSLYDLNVRFVYTSVNPETKAITTHSESHQDFVDGSDAFLVKEGFEERELKHVTKRFGNVATVLSSYEGKVASGKVITRGVNIFQLYFDGKRWWILSMVWDQERPDNMLPAELQPEPH
jgi:hypothetical protein